MNLGTPNMRNGKVLRTYDKYANPSLGSEKSAMFLSYTYEDGTIEVVVFDQTRPHDVYTTTFKEYELSFKQLRKAMDAIGKIKVETYDCKPTLFVEVEGEKFAFPMTEATPEDATKAVLEATFRLTLRTYAQQENSGNPLAALMGACGHPNQ